MIEQSDLELVRLAISNRTRGWEEKLSGELQRNLSACAQSGRVASGYMLQSQATIVVEAYREVQKVASSGLAQALTDLRISINSDDFAALQGIAKRVLPAPTTMRDIWLRAIPNVGLPAAPTDQVAAALQASCEQIARDLDADVRYALERHARSGSVAQHSMQVVFNGAATVGAIQSGSNMTANVTQSTTSIAELAAALETLHPLIASSELDSDAKKEHQAFLDECVASAQSGKPNKTKIGAFLGVLKGTAEGLKNGATLVAAATEVYHLLSSMAS